MYEKREQDDKMNRHAREKIRQAREETGMSQDELAKHIYKTRGAISDIERGRVQITMGDLVLLAGALQKPITYFSQAESLSAREKELISRFRQLGATRRSKPPPFHRSGPWSAQLTRSRRPRKNYSSNANCRKYRRDAATPSSAPYGLPRCAGWSGSSAI
jgi:transcriptional regulator with XRE-family HTH domain